MIGEHPPKCYCCAARASHPTEVKFTKPLTKAFVKRVARTLQSPWALATPASAAQQRYTPSAAATPAALPTSIQNMTGALRIHSGSRDNNMVQANAQSSNASPTGPVQTPAWVVFGLKGNDDFNQIENIGVSHPSMNDTEFFTELKRIEDKHRWPLIKRISPYVFTHCKFVQVRITPISFIISPGRVDLKYFISLTR